MRGELQLTEAWGLVFLGVERSCRMVREFFYAEKYSSGSMR